MKPLAYLLRPQTINEIIGQEHLIGPNGPIKRMIEGKNIPSLILYGNPGIGKTTLALAICNDLGTSYDSFNASADNKARLRTIIETAQNKNNIIIIDEIHRMNKDIQDYLLPYVERGDITLIGITTVNPYHSVNPAIRSRTLIFKLYDLTKTDMEMAFIRTTNYLNIAANFTNAAKDYIISISGGEIRTLINAIEGINLARRNNEEITLELAKEIILKPTINIDKNSDNFYDTLSGLHKSIRGSDANAAIFYLGKLLAAEDFQPIIRRLLCICYEDISLANPAMGPKVQAACNAALALGMPEARLPLASIVIDMALSPKSNSSMLAIDKALVDIEKGKGGNLPPHLKNVYSFDKKDHDYLYPHDYPGAWVNQQYLPNEVINKEYYQPKLSSKYEEALKERYDAIREFKK